MKKVGVSPRSAIMIGIAVFLCGIVMPLGIEQIYSANVTGWDASVKTIFQVLFPILAVVGLAVRFIPRGGK